MRYFFSLGLLVSAILLFVIQPVVAKVLLPVYGGTPAVWTVCMLFFQTLLLVSYGYVWVLSRPKFSAYWRWCHSLVCVLSLMTLPVSLHPVARGQRPEWDILYCLFVQMGLPLLVVAASAPLLQFAYSQTKFKNQSDPYFLYAASNAGSLIALLSYPWVIERFTGVVAQFWTWNIAYVCYSALLFFILFKLVKPSVAEKEKPAVRFALQTKALWLFKSFVPCSLMLGVTFYLTTDVAATPLFWILPLAIYLLSFVLTFTRCPLISHQWVRKNVLFFLIFPVLGFIVGIHQLAAWELVFFHLLSFFMLAMLFHGELARTRPQVSGLATFYVCLALGGVLAGIFNGLLAPLLFSHSYEYPLLILFALLGLPLKKQPYDWMIPVLVGIVLLTKFFLPDYTWMVWLKEKHVLEILMLAVLFIWAQSRRALFSGMSLLFVFIFLPWFQNKNVLLQQRNFYGVKQVFAQGSTHVLMSQSTIHGFQVFSGDNPHDGGRAYYGPVVPVVQRLQYRHRPLHAMVMGLGTGIMACQFRDEDKLLMIEIDKQVIDIAKNPSYFTYLRDCSPKTKVLEEDGRRAVFEQPNGSQDLLVLDAFNSDSIPVHLLTLEAFKSYQKKLKPDGVILVNMSNRHINVLPVLTAIGQKLNLIVLSHRSPGNPARGQLASEWAMLTTDENLSSNLITQSHWQFEAELSNNLWSDNYSNLIPLLKGPVLRNT